jgi:hypothetical protein
MRNQRLLYDSTPSKSSTRVAAPSLILVVLHTRLEFGLANRC